MKMTHSTDTIGVLKLENSNFSNYCCNSFYRYNWSIETSFPITLFYCLYQFYRYNWSIETEFWELKEFRMPLTFYRYNWSIETKVLILFLLVLNTFYRYNWSIETWWDGHNHRCAYVFYRYNWSIETFILFFILNPSPILPIQLEYWNK